MKYRLLFFLISLTLILISTYSIVKWKFKSSVDFLGGTTWIVSFPQEVTADEIKKIFSKSNIDLNTLSINDKNYNLKFRFINQEEKLNLESSFKKINQNYQELHFETVTPSLGKELLRKTIIAVILSSISLLLFIGSRFHDFSFGISAILAMLHDAFILLGAFSLFGHLFGAELDSLFVTALLTTLSASVHDTVVTFDRMRELKNKDSKFKWVDLANQAVSEVIVRSINNSMTIIFMLLALVTLGGSTTRWFAMALLIGVICGTYSSSAVAIPLVLFWKKSSKNN